MRQLRAGRRRLLAFIDRAGRRRPELREQLAEAMVGRTMEGEPLVGRAGERHRRHEDDARNAFTYRSDPDGLRCPFGAHIRRSNPRNADLPPGWPVRSRACGAHAGLRRRGAAPRPGRLDPLPSPAAPRAASTAARRGEETGLHFICLGANIARQFEFVQNAWLIGHALRRPAQRERSAARQPPADAGRQPHRRLLDAASARAPTAASAGLPQFVTVQGGAYFFLPGIRALRYLSKVRAP